MWAFIIAENSSIGERNTETADRVQLSQDRVSWWDFVIAMITSAPAVTTVTTVQRH
jgi:hypothetical protein